jgi:hypothetical protein
MPEKPRRPEFYQPPTRAIRQRVADEGNVPGNPSASALLIIAALCLLGLGLLHLGTLYGPSHVVQTQPATTTK